MDTLSVHIKKIIDRIGWPDGNFTHVALDDDGGTMNIAFFEEQPKKEAYSYRGYRRWNHAFTWRGKGKQIDEEPVKYHDRYDARSFTKAEIDAIVLPPIPEKKPKKGFWKTLFGN